MSAKKQKLSWLMQYRVLSRGWTSTVPSTPRRIKVLKTKTKLNCKTLLQMAQWRISKSNRSPCKCQSWIAVPSDSSSNHKNINKCNMVTRRELKEGGQQSQRTIDISSLNLGNNLKESKWTFPSTTTAFNCERVWHHHPVLLSTWATRRKLQTIARMMMIGLLSIKLSILSSWSSASRTLLVWRSIQRKRLMEQEVVSKPDKRSRQVSWAGEGVKDITTSFTIPWTGQKRQTSQIGPILCLAPPRQALETSAEWWDHQVWAWAEWLWTNSRLVWLKEERCSRLKTLSAWFLCMPRRMPWIEVSHLPMRTQKSSLSRWRIVMGVILTFRGTTKIVQPSRTKKSNSKTHRRIWAK